MVFIFNKRINRSNNNNLHHCVRIIIIKIQFYCCNKKTQSILCIILDLVSIIVLHSFVDIFFLFKSEQALDHYHLFNKIKKELKNKDLYPRSKHQSWKEQEVVKRDLVGR